MSHGSKKWIEAYDGKIIRSTDRTHKDYYRDLKYWVPEENGFYRIRSRRKKFCPQCREASKRVKAIRRASRWHFGEASYLCPKHRTMAEKRDEMWWGPRPGNNPSRGWRKYQYRQYAASVKNKMRNEEYDDIPSKYVHGYLD